MLQERIGEGKSNVLFRTEAGNISVKRNAKIDANNVELEFHISRHVAVNAIHIVRHMFVENRSKIKKLVEISRKISNFLKNTEDGGLVKKAALKLIMAIPYVSEGVEIMKELHESCDPHMAELRDLFVSVDE